MTDSNFKQIRHNEFSWVCNNELCQHKIYGEPERLQFKKAALLCLLCISRQHSGMGVCREVSQLEPTPLAGYIQISSLFTFLGQATSVNGHEPNSIHFGNRI